MKNKKAIMMQEVLLWVLVIIAIIIVLFVFKDSFAALGSKIAGLTAQAKP